MRIEPVVDIPTDLKAMHRLEPNLLWYGPSTVLAAVEGSQTLGVVRIALREHAEIRHGLLTDLSIPDGKAGKELAQELLKAGEAFLLDQKVTKIDAVVVDGKGASAPYLAAGFWASRKTVVIEFPLAALRMDEPQRQFPGVTFEETDKVDPEEAAAFVLSSYQPYWRWWKDDLNDRLWSRIDYPAKEPDATSMDNIEENRKKVQSMLESFNSSEPQHMVLARKEGKIIGLCDAKAVQTGDAFEWGVLLTRDHPGKGFGRALLLPALRWLREQGFQKARITTTSGMDDYDPTVYLYTQNGGKILGEFLNLVKRTV